MAKRRLTAIVPAYNESHHLPGVLESVRFADEVLVVDSLSTDGSAEIAERMADRVLYREYGNSASQKNWAIPQAKHEWILLLDADERVSPALRAEIEAVLSRESLPEHAFWMRRKNWFLGKRVRFSGWQNDRVVRLFRKECRYADKRVHSEIILNGPVGQLRAPLLHHTARSLEVYLNKWRRYARWKAEDAFARGVRPGAFHFLVKPTWRFFRQYVLQGGALDGRTGLVISMLESSSILLRYVYLWDLWRQHDQPGELKDPWDPPQGV
jgi:glycosyltransferase involved in cell wall biosynthesis